MNGANNMKMKAEWQKFIVTQIRFHYGRIQSRSDAEKFIRPEA